MSLKLVSGPNQEPVTVSEVKAHARVEVSDDDALLASYVIAARMFVEGQTHRSLMTQTHDYSIDYDWPHHYGSDRIYFPVNPVQSVTSISYTDGSGATQTLAASQYKVVARENGSYIEPAYDVSWPEVRCEPEAITVRFVSGYIDDSLSPAVPAVPFPLRTAVLMLATQYYEHRGDMMPGSMSENPAIESLISPYRDVGVT